jgi:hypothetical protein
MHKQGSHGSQLSQRVQAVRVQGAVPVIENNAVQCYPKHRYKRMLLSSGCQQAGQLPMHSTRANKYDWGK